MFIADASPGVLATKNLVVPVIWISQWLPQGIFLLVADGSAGT